MFEFQEVDCDFLKLSVIQSGKAQKALTMFFFDIEHFLYIYTTSL